MRAQPNTPFSARGDWAARSYAQVLILHNADGQRMVCEQTHTALRDPNHDSRLRGPARPCRSVGPKREPRLPASEGQCVRSCAGARHARRRPLGLSGNHGQVRGMLGLSGNHGQVRGMLGAGRSFGERALLLNEPRAATIQVSIPLSMVSHLARAAAQRAARRDDPSTCAV